MYCNMFIGTDTNNSTVSYCTIISISTYKHIAVHTVLLLVSVPINILLVHTVSMY